MEGDGLLIGEAAKRSGVSRKALRLYEAAHILPTPRRTASGYRLYGKDALELMAFVTQARRLGFRLDEIKEIVAIRRSGRAPCRHVRDLVQRKVADLDQALADLAEVRRQLRLLLGSWRSQRKSTSGVAICPHIEHLKPAKERR